jgi:hypothetical protein
MIIINGEIIGEAARPTKKGDKYNSLNVPSNGPYTAKCFRAADCEGDFETLYHCKEKYPSADRYYVVNEEFDGWSDIDKVYMDSEATNIVIQNASGSNITINFT